MANAALAVLGHVGIEIKHAKKSTSRETRVRKQKNKKKQKKQCHSAAENRPSSREAYFLGNPALANHRVEHSAAAMAVVIRPYLQNFRQTCGQNDV